MVAHDRLMLVRPVIVAGNRPGADIHAFADRRVSEIAQMIGLRSFAEIRFLHLDKISHLCLGAHAHTRAQMDERPHRGAETEARIDDIIGADQREAEIGEAAGEGNERYCIRWDVGRAAVHQVYQAHRNDRLAVAVGNYRDWRVDNDELPAAGGKERKCEPRVGLEAGVNEGEPS